MNSNPTDVAQTVTPNLVSADAINRWLRGRDLEIRARIYAALNELDEATTLASVAFCELSGGPDNASV
jgi:O-acetyl-ADP-ribose deacetylase (regulator of RNase III)